MAMLHLPPTSGMQSSEGRRRGVFPYLPDNLLELVNPVVVVSVLGRLMLDLLDSWLSWVTMVFMLVPWARECLCTGRVSLLRTMLSLVMFFLVMSISTFPLSTVKIEVGRIFFFNLLFFLIFMMINININITPTQVITAVKATIHVSVFRSSFCTVCWNMTVCRYCGQFALQSANFVWSSQISWHDRHLCSYSSQWNRGSLQGHDDDDDDDDDDEDDDDDD